MAGHKGYAVAVVMDVLSDVLSGSSFGNGVGGPYQSDRRSGAGRVYLALNIEAFLPRPQFDQRMEHLIGQLKSGAFAGGSGEILFPGELEARNEETNLRDGLHLPRQTILDLQALAREVRVTADLPD